MLQGFLCIARRVLSTARGRRGSLRAAQTLFGDRHRLGCGPLAPHAPRKGKKRAKGTSPAGQLQRWGGLEDFLPCISYVPSASSAPQLLHDPAPSLPPAQAGWGPLPTRSPRRCRRLRADASRLFSQREGRRDIIRT